MVEGEGREPVGGTRNGRSAGSGADRGDPRIAARRGAALALVLAGVAVGGMVAIDRTGDGATSARPSSATVATTTTVADAPLAPVTVITSAGSVTSVASVASIAPGTAGAAASVPGTSPAVSGPVSTVPATPVLPGSTLAAAPVTQPAAGTSAPAVDAAAYAVLDVTHGRWLAELDADAARPVASLMKLLTAYVVMQAGEPERVVTVPALQLDPMESAIGLYAGEQLPRDVLLRAMMIVSANDAARALAIDVGGSIDAFVGMMNETAASLGLGATNAANPIGLDADGATSSARDMAGLAAVLMQDETFRATAARTSASLHGQTFPATNASFLTGYDGATGVKTGHTTGAGWCLAASATRDGRQLVAVVLGSSSASSRVAAASALLDWGFSVP